jgi:pyruvate dehydrogenase (quinone)
MTRSSIINPWWQLSASKARCAGGNYQQEVDLISLFKDIAHEYVHMVSTPEQMRHMVDRAMRITQVERNVCCIIVPNDIQEMDTKNRRMSMAPFTPEL